MNFNIFMEGIVDLQKTFSADRPIEYNQAMLATIKNVCMKWREDTFKKVIELLKNDFKKSWGVDLPYPKDFHVALNGIHREDEKTWKKDKEPETAIDTEGYLIYKKQVAELVKKMSMDKKFRLTTSHLDGVFACEVCFREGCNGRSERALRNGCPGFLSEEMHKECLAKQSEAEKEIYNKYKRRNTVEV